MHVFTFRSRTYPGMNGFTTWRTGANLPEEFRPWVFASQGAMHAGDPVTGVHRGADAALAEIERYGSYVARIVGHARQSA
jgi:hypothetical protein